MRRTVLGEAHRLLYGHTTKGPRFHDFGGGVRVVGLPSGKVELEGARPLWTPRGPWLENTGRAPLVAQSVLFERKRWTPARARKWLVAHGYRAGKMDRTANELRFRQRAPRTIRSYVTRRFGRGIEAVMGHRKNPALAVFGNPGRKGKHMAKRRRHKRPVPAGFKSWRAYMEHIRGGAKGMARKRRHRRNDPGPRRRHRAHASRNDPGRRRRHRGYRRNPGFLAEIPRAFMTSLGVVAGKVGARWIPSLVKIQPVGLMGLVTQGLAGGLAAFGVHLFAPKFGVNMLVGTFTALEESLLRTPVGGKPLPIVGTALSDYTELYRLAGYNRPLSNLSDYRRGPVPRVAANLSGRSKVLGRMQVFNQ